MSLSRRSSPISSSAAPTAPPQLDISKLNPGDVIDGRYKYIEKIGKGAFGTVLLMPPLAGSMLIDGKIGGIPIPLLAIFAVWAALIAGAAALSSQLREADTQDTPPEAEG